jgi:hypothetical protein
MRRVSDVCDEISRLGGYLLICRQSNLPDRCTSLYWFRQFLSKIYCGILQDHWTYGEPNKEGSTIPVE